MTPRSRLACLCLTLVATMAGACAPDSEVPWQSEAAFTHLASTPIADADYSGFEVTELSGEILSDDTRLGQIGALVVDGDVLWLLDELGDPWLHVIDRRDGSYLTGAGRRGEGPGEFGLLSAISPDAAGGIWGGDLATNRLTHLRHGDQVDLVRVTPLPPEFASTFRIVRLDDRFLGWALQGENNLRIIADDGTAIRTATLVPGPDSVDARVRSYAAANNRLCAAPDGSRAVIAYFDVGRADLMDRDGNAIAQVEVPFPRPAVFERTAGGSHESERVVMHYEACATTADRVYLLYSGAAFTWPVAELDPPINNHARMVHVFDWNGKPSGILRLDRVVTSIAVAADGSELYATDFESGGLIRYPIP